MTGLKLGWLIWCILWMFFWMTIGWILFPLNIIMFMLSGVATIPSLVGNHRPAARPVAPVHTLYPPTPGPRGIDQ